MKKEVVNTHDTAEIVYVVIGIVVLAITAIFVH